MSKSKLQFNVIYRPEPEGGYTAMTPSLPGRISFGKNLAEARRMISDSVEGYLASVKKQGEVVVSDVENLVGSIEVTAPSRVVARHA